MINVLMKMMMLDRCELHTQLLHNNLLHNNKEIKT